MYKERIRMLGFDAERRECVRREMPQIKGDYHLSMSMNGCG